MAMAPGTIVKNFNVIEDIGANQVARFVNAFANPLPFETAEERLCDRIVPAVATPAHTGSEVIDHAESAPVAAAVLTALIGQAAQEFNICCVTLCCRLVALEMPGRCLVES